MIKQMPDMNHRRTNTEDLQELNRLSTVRRKIRLAPVSSD